MSDEIKRGPGRPPKPVEVAEPTVKALVLRDFWPTEDNRVRAGTIIDVTKDELILGLERATLARHTE
jgi:hypothetical protein